MHKKFISLSGPAQQLVGTRDAEEIHRLQLLRGNIISPFASENNKLIISPPGGGYSYQVFKLGRKFEQCAIIMHCKHTRQVFSATDQSHATIYSRLAVSVACKSLGIHDVLFRTLAQAVLYCKGLGAMKVQLCLTEEAEPVAHRELSQRRAPQGSSKWLVDATKIAPQDRN